MPDFQEFMKSEQARRLTRDTNKLAKLRDAPETQRLFQLLSQSAGGDLEQAAGRAANGDAEELMAAVRRLMEDPEGQKLLERMKKSME